VDFEGHARDPWGGDRAVFSAKTKINREDFGISWNVALEAGGLLVSKEVQIEIDLETVLDRA
jgi:polyisoprenoid-binding protein YceI